MATGGGSILISCRGDYLLGRESGRFLESLDLHIGCESSRCRNRFGAVSPLCSSSGSRLHRRRRTSSRSNNWDCCPSACPVLTLASPLLRTRHGLFDQPGQPGG